MQIDGLIALVHLYVFDGKDGLLLDVKPAPAVKRAWGRPRNIVKARSISVGVRTCSTCSFIRND